MKICFKCHSEKPLHEFYRHPQMGDGHLNKCKDCSKKDSESRRYKLESTNLQWTLAERERHRKKSEAFRKAGRAVKETPAEKLKKERKYRALYPDKNKARQAVSRAVRGGKLIKQPCEVCGKTKADAHHDDYAKPLDVMWLCRRHHADRHVELNTQKVRAMFEEMAGKL